jgi:Bcl2-/adenovirus E1B nineteen kDa-interacting protein 2
MVNCSDSRPSSAADTLTHGERQRRPTDEEDADGRSEQWSTVTISDKQYRLDLKVIEPYKRVLSHGGH